MHTLSVARTIPAPIEEVFDAYTDHEALARVPGVRSCRVTRPGKGERNGLGAIRELDCGLLRLREEIVAFERPHLMEYRVLASRPPATHRLGRVEFLAIPEGTVVIWATVFGLRIPAIGNLLTPAFALLFAVSFRLVLADVERRVTAEGVGEI
jgi:uncharacterized protein YndB with AHSA1/START domain